MDKTFEQVKKLIEQISDSYDLPTKKQTEKMQKLTGINWSAEDLQMQCCEYWSHNTLEETAYFMLHGEYPSVRDVNLVFWQYKPGVVMNDREVFEKYRLGKGKLKALQALPLNQILQKINDLFTGWQKNDSLCDDKHWRFDCLDRTEDWMDTHFWILEYGRDVDSQREHQILKFCCHNMNDEQIGLILECMGSFQCSLHIREEK